MRYMLLCVRTTIDLNDELLLRAKRRAAEERVPLREIVERALRSELSGKRASASYRLALRPFHGKGLQTGISENDLGDRDRLFEIMEGRR